MAGKTIPIRSADGGAFSGYLATPSCGSGPGLLLLQEIFGVNHHIRALADLYAEEGYVVLAPDLFWRIKPGIELGYSDDDFKAALDYYQRFDVDQAIRDAGDALKTLRANAVCNGKAGALGFCLGGKLAYLAAARLPIDAAVSYYGVALEQNLAEAQSINVQLRCISPPRTSSSRQPHARRFVLRSPATTAPRFTSIPRPITPLITGSATPTIAPPPRSPIRARSACSAA